MDITKEILDEIKTLKFNSDMRALRASIKEKTRRRRVLEALSTKLEVANALYRAIESND